MRLARHVNFLATGPKLGHVRRAPTVVAHALSVAWCGFLGTESRFPSNSRKAGVRADLRDA